MNAIEAQKHEVLVLGAGYAGLAAAIQLAARTRKRGDVRVTLVNPFEKFTERLRLHMTATGQETAEMTIRELLEGTGAVFVRGRVTALDVSKSLFPAVRVGWMVLPVRLVDSVLAAKGTREASVSVLDQLTLADFIASGQYDRHIRRMRQRYRLRRDRLVTALAEQAPHIAATGVAAGLHAVLRLPPGTEVSAVKAASWQGIALDGLAGFRHPRASMPVSDGLVIGYSVPAEHAYGAAIEALLRALPPGAAGSPALWP